MTKGLILAEEQHQVLLSLEIPAECGIQMPSHLIGLHARTQANQRLFKLYVDMQRLLCQGEWYLANLSFLDNSTQKTDGGHRILILP